jgi:prepilin-type N-terminal cleavage/methylation domain-containing protein
MKRHNKGFTLMQMMITIALLGVVAMVVIPRLV